MARIPSRLNNLGSLGSSSEQPLYKYKIKVRMPTEQDPVLPSPPPRHPRGLAALLTAHTFEYYTSRTWEFAWPFWLAMLVPNSLAPLSIYGMTLSLGTIFFGGKVGALLDRPIFTRWAAVRSTVVIAKLSMVAACAVFLVWFQVVQHPSDSWIAKAMIPWLPAPGPVQIAVFLAPLIVIGLAIKLSNTGYVISVERDWVPVLAREIPGSLPGLNGWIRRIDLLCKLLAPIVIAWLISVLPDFVPIVGLAAFSLLDLCIELVLFNYVRQHHPALSLPKNAEHAPIASPIASTNVASDRGLGPSPVAEPSDYNTISTPEPAPAPAPVTTTLTQTKQPPNIVRYLRHPILLASLSMAFLYLTVLSFGGQMIEWLVVEMNSTAQTIAWYRAVGGVAGVLATYTAPPLITRYGPMRIGLWSIWLQTLSLVPAAYVMVRGMYFPGTSDDTAVMVTVLCISVSVSRLFLWSFDMAHTQVMQENVAEDEIGAINGMHYAACSVSDLGMYMLTLVWWAPRDFGFPVLVSVACVGAGAVTWTLYV
ncbi:Ferroporti-1 [Blastocladiella britannica]|nr:Ferroporti-1 [Blastocladiella britannica]